MFQNQEPHSTPVHLTWKRFKAVPGTVTKMKAWLAGPMVAVHTHYLSGNKACRRLITAGNLKCEHCASMKLNWCGYVPFWNEHLKRIVVVFSAGAKESIERLDTFEPVLISKGSNQTDDWRVNPDRTRDTTPLPELAAVLGAQDIHPWLLNMWQDPELTAYFGTDLKVAPTITAVDIITKVKAPAVETLSPEALKSQLGEWRKRLTSGSDHRSDGPAQGPAIAAGPVKPSAKRPQPKGAASFRKNGKADADKSNGKPKNK